MAPDQSDGSRAAPPPHPFDERWYVRTENEILGPYEGWRIKELIELGQIGRQTLIARVGAAEWSAVKDIPVFDTLVRAEAGPGTRQPVSRAPSPRVEIGGVRYAGFWIRVAAYIVDYVIINVIVIAVSGLVGLAIGLTAGFIASRQGEQANLPDYVGVVGAVIAVALIIVYYVKFNSGAWQATPGKRLVGIHIVRVSGEPVSGWLAFGRYLAYFVSVLPLCLGFMWVGWNEEKKGFHDMMCNTRVIYGKL